MAGGLPERWGVHAATRMDTGTVMLQLLLIGYLHGRHPGPASALPEESQGMVQQLVHKPVGC